MKLKAKTYYVDNRGKCKYIMLYRAWKNLKGRVKGTHHDGKGNYRWKGLNNDFTSWHEFREWSLDNGFNKTNCSLDRIDETKGYSPDNCQWLTKGDNARKAVDKRMKRNPA